jgi:hypothetical protein
MSSDAKLKAEFAAPVSGSTKVSLSDGNNHYQFFPSYTPYDSFTELANALLAVLDGNHKAVVRWNDEPVEHKFVFTTEGERVSFKVYEVINSVVAGKVDQERFGFEGTRREVLRPFWKGLRDMQSRQDPKEYEKQWHSPFPEREILELKHRVK